MTTTQQDYVTARSSDEPTGWTGWIAFAAIMMIIGGGLNMLWGFVAVVNDDWVVFTNRQSVFLDLSAWGWAQLLVGLLVLLCGFWLLTGNMFARIVGVVIAGLSLIGNFLIVPVYPVWALTIIVIDLLVIWAITAHGREMKEV